MKVLKHITWLVIAMVLLAVSAFATGDPNIDGGGGGTGDGDVGGGNYWNVGDDGVRVTIVYEGDNSLPAPTPKPTLKPTPIPAGIYKDSDKRVNSDGEAEVYLSGIGWLPDTQGGTYEPIL